MLMAIRVRSVSATATNRRAYPGVFGVFDSSRTDLPNSAICLADKTSRETRYRRIDKASSELSAWGWFYVILR